MSNTEKLKQMRSELEAVWPDLSIFEVAKLTLDALNSDSVAVNTKVVKVPTISEVINSGAIRWLGASSKVDEMVFATGAKSAVEVGHQEIDGKYSGVSTAREQRQFIIDPDLVRSLPTFHWFVSLGQKVSHLYVPPLK